MTPPLTLTTRPAWDEALAWDERIARIDAIARAAAVERLQQAKTFRHCIAVYTGGISA